MQPSRPVVALAAAAFVVGVVLVASRVAGPDPDPRPPAAVQPTEEPTRAGPARVATRLPVDRVPDRQCLGPPVTTTPEIPDYEEQVDVALAALQVFEPEFDVVLAGPTHLGVVAVVDGDDDAARAALPDVPHVVAISLPLRALADDHEAQLTWVVSALLDPAVREVRDTVAGLAGEQAVTSWPAGGSVVVTWAAPVPPAVRDLDGVRGDGARVLVVEVPHSARDLRRAVARATRAIRALGVTGPISGHPCPDGSGIDLSVQSGRPLAQVRRAVRSAVDVPVNLLVYPADGAPSSR